MKREKIVSRLLVVGLFAVTALAGSSFSQAMSDRLNGVFDLPFEAHWGTLDLKPGAYSFSVKHNMDMDLVTVEKNNRPVGFVVATLFTSLPHTTELSKGALLCASHDGTCVISALAMPWRGIYHFYVPRGARTIDTAAVNPAQSIPVLFAQN